MRPVSLLELALRYEPSASWAQEFCFFSAVTVLLGEACLIPALVRVTAVCLLAQICVFETAFLHHA